MSLLSIFYVWPLKHPCSCHFHLDTCCYTRCSQFAGGKKINATAQLSAQNTPTKQLCNWLSLSLWLLLSSLLLNLRSVTIQLAHSSIHSSVLGSCLVLLVYAFCTSGEKKLFIYSKINSLLCSLAKNSSTHQGTTDNIYLMESYIKSGSELHISHAGTFHMALGLIISRYALLINRDDLPLW